MSDKHYYVRARGKVLGPFSAGQLRSLQGRGQLSRFDEVSEDRQHWVSASEVQELFPVLEAAAAPSVDTRPAEQPEAARPTDAQEWYFVNEAEQQQGPVSRSRLLKLRRSGTIDDDTPVWTQGMTDWLPLADALDDVGGPRRRRRRDLAPHRGTLILVLAIVGLVACFPLCIFAWVMGQSDLNKIRAGVMDPEGEGMTNAGRIIGIIGTVLVLVGLVCGLGWFVMMLGMAGAFRV